MGMAHNHKRPPGPDVKPKPEERRDLADDDAPEIRTDGWLE